MSEPELNASKQYLSNTGSNRTVILPMPILAIDFGEKRIGLAICDSLGVIASPIQPLIFTQNRALAEQIESLHQIITEYRIKSILLGSPQAFIEKHLEIVKKIARIKERLETEIDLPIMLWDESFSTSEAQNMLLSLGQNRRKYKDKIDSIAAAVFLQNYLDSKQNDRKN